MGLLQQMNKNKGLHSTARLKIIACLTVIVEVSMHKAIISCSTSLVNDVDPFFPPQMLCDLLFPFTSLSCRLFANMSQMTSLYLSTSATS